RGLRVLLRAPGRPADRLAPQLLLPRRGAALLRGQRRRGPRRRGAPVHVLVAHESRGRTRRPELRLRPEPDRQRRLRVQEELRLHAAAARLRVPARPREARARPRSQEPALPPARERVAAAAARAGERDRPVGGAADRLTPAQGAAGSTRRRIAYMSCPLFW